MINSVVIASNAGFLVEALYEKLSGVNFKVYLAGNDKDLTARIKFNYPRFVFLEHCFDSDDTDNYVYKIIKVYRSLHIVIWTALDIKPIEAARFIHAGAESFFSLRDTVDNVEKIINRIAIGKTYCPADVEAVLDSDSSIPVFGVPLTDREIQIVKLFGYGDKEIAQRLSLSVHTVVYHKTNIYKKCPGKRKNEILREAVKKGIIKQADL